MDWVVLSSIVAVAVYAAAIYCAFLAAATARTPQGAVGWVVFLLAAPFMALPFYAIFGHHRFRGYRISRRESQRVVDGIRQHAAQHTPDLGTTRIDLRPFENIANMPALRGNGADLLIDGPETFDAIFEALDAARDYALVQFYIVRDDVLGQQLKQKMVEAARRGVDVYFLTDAVGSLGLPRHYFDELAAAGVHTVQGRRPSGPRYRFQINYRNHRKTVVVDGRVGFTGGLNVGDEYMGRDPGFGRWRDTHARLFGPIVLQLQLIFVEDWHFATGQQLLDELSWDSPEHAQDATALLVATGPGDTTETGALMFFSAITEARQRVWIASPYFVPDIDILAALRHAAMRGVDVRILMPDLRDHWFSWLAAFAYFDDMIEAGVRIFRYTDGFMHQKVFVVDEDLAAVGTTNLDNRSFRLNFEAMALFFDADAATAVDRMLCEDFKRAYELTQPLDQQSPLIRYGAPLARLLSPVL